MNNHRRLNYRVGISLIILTFLSLMVTTWWGLEAKRETVWAKAKAESQEIADEFLEGLKKNRRTIRNYDYPASLGSMKFDSKAELAVLRGQIVLDDKSLSGVPIAVLSAYEIAKRTENERDAEVARDLTLNRWPNPTSPIILKNLMFLAAKNQWDGDFITSLERWNADEEARDLFRENYNEKEWISSNGSIYNVVNLTNNEFSYVKVSPSSAQWQNRHLGIQLDNSGFTLGEAGITLAKMQDGDALLKVGILDANSFEAEWRNQRNYTLLLFAFTTLVIGAGIWMTARSILNERRLSYLKSQFVASVTHELRAPIGAIRLMAENLESGGMEPEEVTESHQLISTESGRLSTLIENVMGLAQVEGGERSVLFEPFCIHELVSEVCGMMKMQAQQAGITLIPVGKAMTVSSDGVILRQVLVNLVDNALKFSPRETEITLDWGEGWWISVADQGPGVPKEMQSHVFERFFRGEDELRRKTKGVGIGLSLVSELVILLKGTVSVSNQNGAVFTVEFKKS